jgi:hypothetical protein
LLFWSGFGVVLEFCAILLKTCDNKTNPRINSLIFNALQTSLKRLIFNGFTHLLVLGGWVKGRVLSKG